MMGGPASCQAQPLSAELRDHRRAMLVGPDFADESLVFHQPDGSWLKPDPISAQFQRRVDRMDVPRITLKGLRHTWATLALENGIHPRVVQERLGHSTITITLGIYSHVAPTLHDETAEQVTGLILRWRPRIGPWAAAHLEYMPAIPSFARETWNTSTRIQAE